MALSDKANVIYFDAQTTGRRFDGVARGIAAGKHIYCEKPTAVSSAQAYELYQLAKKAGVKHLVKLSGIMPELDSPFRFARMHGQIEDHLAASGMTFTNVRAGEFMQAYFRQVPTIVARHELRLR